MPTMLTKDFSSDEFACKCGACQSGPMNPEFMRKLQMVRDAVGRPLRITSGWRCPSHNKICGGLPDSQHLTGHAADISCILAGDKFALIRAAIQAGMGGVGVAKEFVHLDDRPSFALWTYS